jgi:DNA modification methylase
VEKFKQILLLDVNSINIKEDRQRQTFDPKALVELAEKIQEKGLLHPPGIDTKDTRNIVFGERRLRCLQVLAKKGVAIKFNGDELPVGLAPFINCKETDPLALEEIELMENQVRQDLTWQESTRAIARIREILLARRKRDLPEVVEIDIPMVEIAEVAKTSVGHAYQHVDIAKHLDDPEVMKAKTKKEAQKLIAKKKTQEFRAEKAATFVAKDSDHKIFQGDCREVIKTLAPNQFTSVVTDPPYGIEMHKDQSWDGTWHEYDDTEAYCFNLIEQLLPEWDRTTQREAHLYLFCDFSKFEKIKAIVLGYRKKADGTVVQLSLTNMYEFLNLGYTDPSAMDLINDSAPVFEPMYFPFIWNKGNVASYPRPEHWPRKSYECILYAIKGNHPQTSLDLAVIDVPQLQDQPHPAGKPYGVYEKLVLRSTNAGDAVLDCFAGQGNLLRACRNNKRLSVSIELSDTYYPLLVEAYDETNSNS